jgi:hypothetical protein
MYYRQPGGRQKPKSREQQHFKNMINVTKNSLEPTGSVTFIVALL